MVYPSKKTTILEKVVNGRVLETSSVEHSNDKQVLAILAGLNAKNTDSVYWRIKK